MTLLDKISELRNRFTFGRADAQDVSVIDGWLERAKKLMLLQSLKGHDGVKYVLEVFTSEIEKINDVLQNKYSKELSDSERDRLLDKRELAQKYVNLFSSVEGELEKLEEDVDKEL